LTTPREFANFLSGSERSVNGSLNCSRNFFSADGLSGEAEMISAPAFLNFA
jgi:hypothetical protein